MRIALISVDQFGYHTDVFMYAKYLSKDNEIHVFCFDKGRDRYTLPGVEVHYSHESTRIMRWARLVQSVFASKHEIDIFFVKYFIGCSIFSLLLKRRKTIMDIRTLSVNTNPLKRKVEDAILNLEALAFGSLSVVSSQLAEVIWRRKINVINLGAEVKQRAKQDVGFYSRRSVRLLYVGTLHNRSIENLIQGMSLYEVKHKHNPFHLTVVGSGYKDEEQVLKRLVESLGLEKFVTLTGHLKGKTLESQFQRADVGVVQVPNTPYFKNQPSTKLFEYLAHGLPVLASDYPMNRLAVSAQVGIIYKDSPLGFAEGLEKLVDQATIFSAHEINFKATSSQWITIVELELLPILNRPFR